VTRVVNAAATASQSGSLALQGADAALGLRWWATHSGVDIELRDDASSTSTARLEYRSWVDADVDILLGPYGSNLVRAVIPVVAGSGKLVWNHGGSADDLAHPMVVPLPAPASTYLNGAVEIAAEVGAEEILLAAGSGPFATSVGSGVRKQADRISLPVKQCELASLSAVAAEATKAAVLITANFDREVAAIAKLSDTQFPLIACVAAGLPEFHERLGDAAEGVVGPVQWIPQATNPDIGPSGAEYARRYQATYGNPPSYVAAQATAAGFLAEEAHRLDLRPEQVQAWQTSTLLGSFALDESWRQVGHRVHIVRWHEGHQITLR